MTLSTDPKKEKEADPWGAGRPLRLRVVPAGVVKERKEAHLAEASKEAWREAGPTPCRAYRPS